MKVGDLTADIYNPWLGMSIILEIDIHKKGNEQALLHWFCNNKQVWTHISRFKIVSEAPNESSQRDDRRSL
jgi:hypothetical protein